MRSMGLRGCVLKREGCGAGVLSPPRVLRRRAEGRKGGREEERKDGREDGRKGGREEGKGLR